MRILVLIFLLTGCSSPQQAKKASPPTVERANPARKSAGDVTADKLQLKRQQENDESAALINKAIDAANAGELGPALDLAIEATTLNRENHYAWFVQAQLHNTTKAYEDAIEAFRQAIRIKPGDATYQYRLGRALYLNESKESRASAIPILERAVSLDPKLYAAHYYLGLAYKSQGMTKKSAQSLTTAASLEPTYGIAFVALGRLYIQWRMLDEAVSVLSQGASRERDKGTRSELYYHLGIALGRKNDLPRAVSAYNECLAVNAHDVDALRQRGFAYAEAGDTANAKKDLVAFVKQDGGSGFFLHAANQILNGRKYRRKKQRKSKFRPQPLEEAPATLALPAPPDFSITAMVGDAYSVQEMLVRGPAHEGNEVKIRGHISWIYDCGTAIRTADMSKADLTKILAEEPERCLRPHFHLGISKQHNTHNWIEVVEVPRKLRPDEKKFLSTADLGPLPPVPVLKLGSEVIVTGTWDLRSPKGFYNSEGLLVYKSIEPAPKK